MKRRLGEQPIEADVKWLRVLLGKCGLAQPGGWLPYTAYQVVPYNIGGLCVAFVATIPRDLTVRSWDQVFYVGSPNDGSNYWTLRLDFYRVGVISPASFTTAGYSPATWHRKTTSNIDTFVDSSTYYASRVYVITKTGSPGGLFLGAPAVFVT